MRIPFLIAIIISIFSLNLNMIQAQQKILEIINVQSLGAKGDGRADDTYAIQKAINTASQKGLKLYFPKGIYTIRKIRIHHNIKEVYGENAVIKGIITSDKNISEGLIEFDGIFLGQEPVKKLKFHDLVIDVANSSRRALFLSGNNSDCEIYNLQIKGLDEGGFSESAIYLYTGCNGNKIYNNKISLAKIGNLMGIYMVGNLLDPYGGFGKDIKITSNTTIKNQIFKNTIDGGSHGISLFASDNNEIFENKISQSKDRGIILSPRSSHNIVRNNIITNFGSSGIHMAYFSSDNIIKDNWLESPESYGEGGIQAYVYCSGNSIQNNTISCSSNFGIYIAINSDKNFIEGNTISGNIKKSYIAVEADWRDRNLEFSKFSRPNYGIPPNNSKAWASGNSENNSITKNKIISSAKDICAICLIDIGNKKVLNTNISNNSINTRSITQIQKIQIK